MLDSGAKATYPACAQQDGILVLHKPAGPTSAACIARIKRHLGQKKIGHAGTLDPMASGVLLVLLGQGTKLSSHLTAAGEKVYAATVKLGECTDTWDAEGRVQATGDYAGVTLEMVQEILSSWHGHTEQEVPPYSAAKHQGRPLYELARKGLEIPVKTNTVHISRVELEWIRLPQIRFRVRCSSGTYIRFLAHSLGMRLGCGAVLVELTREYSHPFGISEAHDLEEVVSRPEDFASRIVPLSRALPAWPLIRLTDRQAALARNGCALAHGELSLDLTCAPGKKALLAGENDEPLALATGCVRNGKAHWAIVRGLWN